MADAYSMMFLWLVDSAALFVRCQYCAGFLCHILGFLARPGVRADILLPPLRLPVAAPQEPQRAGFARSIRYYPGQVVPYLSCDTTCRSIPLLCPFIVY